MTKWLRALTLAFCYGLLFGGARQVAYAESLKDALAALESGLPKKAEDFAAVDPVKLFKLTDRVEAAAVAMAVYPEPKAPPAVEEPEPEPERRPQRRFRRQAPKPPEAQKKKQPAPDVSYVLPQTHRLLDAKYRVDGLLSATLAKRDALATDGKDEAERVRLRGFLATSTRLIDLSGKLRYLLVDALEDAASLVAGDAPQRERLVDLLLQYRSSVGATTMAVLLFDPPAGAPAAAAPPTPAFRFKILKLIASSRAGEQLPVLARMTADLRQPPALRIAAAEAILAVGLPQDIRPGQDPTLPKPAITAQALLDQLKTIDARRLDPSLTARRTTLTTQLEKQSKTGFIGVSLRVGEVDVQPGDWLLMRNPSPYNMFTDLKPGLFTHVGIVAEETGADGRRRMVIVDLPERGAAIPATNVDAYLQRTRHYAFLRCRDTALAAKIGAVAQTLIGQESLFDLNFRTSRVDELVGDNLKSKRIHTYCAGFLLLCGRQSGAARELLFPVAERPAAGNCPENLGKLGLSMGEDFISPTGALFSKNLILSGWREPTFEPRREVEEAVYDYFAESMIAKRLNNSPDLYQSLRQRVAEASRTNPLLAEALAKAANVNADIDLVAAAKTAAVIENLDAVARQASSEFLDAMSAVHEGPLDAESTAGLSPKDIAAIKIYRDRHQALCQAWDAERISSRDLRRQLTAYYIALGRSLLDKQFFAAGGETPVTAVPPAPLK